MDDRLLDRYLSGESPPAERALVDQWIAESPERAQMLEAMRAGDVARWDVDGAWQRLATRIDSESGQPSTASVISIDRRRSAAPSPRRAPWVRYAIRIAAGIVVLGGSTLIIRERLARQAADASTSAMREVTTLRGKRAEVRLPDGTRVVLAAASQLQYPAAFTDRREVRLIGEAYFQVAHDSTRPFLVTAGGAVTQVLGTEFSVRALAGEADVEVVVASGSVSLRRVNSSDTGAVLTRGQLGRLGETGSPIVVAVEDVARRLGWTDGRLALADVQLTDAVAELERWYDAEIEVPDSALGARRLTAVLGTESLPWALDAIALALDARWERRDGRVVILPK